MSSTYFSEKCSCRLGPAHAPASAISPSHVEPPFSGGSRVRTLHTLSNSKLLRLLSATRRGQASYIRYALRGHNIPILCLVFFTCRLPEPLMVCVLIHVVARVHILAALQASDRIPSSALSLLLLLPIAAVAETVTTVGLLAARHLLS